MRVANRAAHRLIGLSTIGFIALGAYASSSAGAPPDVTRAAGQQPTIVAATTAGAEAGKCTNPTKLTFRLNWVNDYEQVPYYAALENGYYRAQCLDVTIQPGRGSTDTVTIVGAGTAQIGIADTTSVMTGQAKGVPVTGVGVAWQKNTAAVFFGPKTLATVHNPPQLDDLYGKTYGAVTFASPYIFWRAFAKQQNLDLSKIKQVSLTPPGYAELSQGAVDFIITFGEMQALLEAKGVQTRLLKFADFGMQGYGLAILANNAWLKDHKDAMKGFLIATARGMDWSIKHPEEGVKIEAKVEPTLVSTPEVLAANIKVFKIAAAGWGNDYFGFDTAGLKASEKILYDGGVLTGTEFDVIKHWTTEYVPPPSAYRSN
ncbi:MAG: ABC transporter substrate-binding protein [Burkholderiales bacterium]|nr:ABC transporter substrate-binding protein [Burkholderiales bacterium]